MLQLAKKVSYDYAISKNVNSQFAVHRFLVKIANTTLYKGFCRYETGFATLMVISLFLLTQPAKPTIRCKSCFLAHHFVCPQEK